MSPTLLEGLVVLVLAILLACLVWALRQVLIARRAEQARKRLVQRYNAGPASQAPVEPKLLTKQGEDEHVR